MCGISGFLHRARATAEDVLEAQARRMAEAIRHRGPDDAGTWADARFGIAFGHRRLSIIDLSSLGHQPMTSGCGRYVACYNGEIYNFQTLRKELEALGHTFRGHSDTEVMLAAFTRWGFAEALKQLNGMFAMAVWDRQEACLHLARDRMGEKPLYYGWAGEHFLFGSELKALRAHPDFRAEIDRDALALYFRHNYIPAPHSIYRGIRKLPPGTYATLRADDAPGTDPTPQAYWDVREAAAAGCVDPLRLPEPELLERLDTLLTEAVGLRMISDVPLGAFLSGGIDSSTVVALMQAQSARPVRTFTIGFHEAAYNEAEQARAVAAHLGTEHTVLYLTPEETREVIPLLPGMYDEPFADSSQIPTYLVSHLARRHVTVSLSGDGGDELFGGYDRYAAGQRHWNVIGRMPRPLRVLAAGLLDSLPHGAWRVLERIGPQRLAGGPVTAYRGHKAATMFRIADFAAFYRELVSHWYAPLLLVRGASEPATALVQDNVPSALRDVRQQMMLLDMLSYLPDDILAKMDRASMAVSLESRIPLLDHRVVELAWRTPLSLAFGDGAGKYPLRRLLSRYLPAELIDRPKQGFAVPIGTWLRGPLRDWGEALLAEARLEREGFLHPTPVRAMWTEHQSGRRDWAYHLWDVLMLQAWLERTGTS